MGQSSSRSTIASSVHNFKLKRKKRSRCQSDLSHTFSVLDRELHYEQLNINTAAEEELMTLPTISRTIARNIIEYRQTIGSFRKVEDLALVSGVGATKFEQIRAEICVCSKNRAKSNLSQTSSLSPSLESLASSIASNSKSSRGTKVVNINKANVFQLMTIRGIDQLIAANIVHHREKKGPFKTPEDLGKVKGLNHRFVADLRQHLTTDPDVAPLEHVPRTPQRTPLNTHRTTPTSSSHHHRRTRSMPPTKFEPVLISSFDSADLFELLSSKSRRPVVEEVFNFRRNSRTALRLATWNIQQFVREKADNPGVREVICRTILENGLSLIAFQELGDKEVLETICSELNNPCLRKVQHWKGERGTWEYVTCDAVGKMNEFFEYSGFLYDTSRGLELKDSSIVNLPSTSNPPTPSTNGSGRNSGIHSALKKPFWAKFRIEKIEFTAVCLHLSPDKNRNSNERLEASKMADVLKILEETQSNNNFIILGDMGLSPIEPEFNALRERGFTHIVPLGTHTSVGSSRVVFNTSSGGGGGHTNGSTMTSSSSLQLQRGFDNIWISKSIQKNFTGHWSVVRQGLYHLAIPQGWTWGGSASDHCPVWAEFYAHDSSSSSSMRDSRDSPKISSVVANGKIREEEDEEKTSLTTSL